jgi:hypothetical protein
LYFAFENTAEVLRELDVLRIDATDRRKRTKRRRRKDMVSAALDEYLAANGNGEVKALECIQP